MFGIGGSKSRSSSEAYGYSRSGSSSESLSRGSSQSTSSSAGRSFTDIAFEDIFASLYGNASGAAARVAQLVPGFSEQASQLFSGGIEFLEQLGGGDAYLERRVSGDDGLLDEQIGALQEDIGRLFREELNPAITARAVAGGTLGGGRQGVAQGRAMGVAADEFRRGVTELRLGDRAQRDAIAGALMENRTNAAGIGLDALPGLGGIAQMGFGAELAPWQALASILGGPTTLAGSEQASYSQSSAEDIARAIAESFGISEDWARSSSKSGGFSIGFGA